MKYINKIVVFFKLVLNFIQGTIPNVNEGPASSQEGGSGQTPTGSESSAGGRRPGGGNKLYFKQVFTLFSVAKTSF